MKYRTTLRDELEKEIATQGYSLSHFSKISGINKGVLSATLNGNPPKPISIKQLDQMNQALGKAEGSWYPLFMQDCFEERKANWRRVRSLIIRCMDLELIDITKKTLYFLLENLIHIKHIFDLAEELYNKSYRENILPFYKCIVEHERDYQSERLAISQYRIFHISIGTDLEENFRNSASFLPFLNRLPDHLLLDAIVELANIAYIMQDWNKVYQYGDKLIQISNIVYQQQHNKKHDLVSTNRHLVVYYFKSYLFKFTALHRQGKYKEAEPYIVKLSNFSWYKNLDEVGKLEVERFKIHALMNKYNINILMGDINKLYEYIEIIKHQPNEQLSSLFIIFKASNIHQWNVDDLLSTYSYVFYPTDIMKVIFSDSYYIDVRLSQYISLYYEIALYQCNKGIYDKHLEKILLALESTVTKYNKSRILDCLELFKKLRLISKNGN